MPARAPYFVAGLSLITGISSASAFTSSVPFRAPLAFESRGAAFIARGAGYGMRLDEKGALLSLRSPHGKRDLLQMQLVGAAPAKWRSEGALPSRSNYFIGKNPRDWRRDVPHFARVRAEKIYRGIDAVFYGNGRQLEYDWIVAPGADTQQIRLRFAGAQKLSLAQNGDLLLQMRGGTLRQHKPIAFQTIGGRRVGVAAAYQIAPRGEVRLQLGKYDRRQKLVIDPVLSYATYLGGSAIEDPGDLTVDSAGNVYVVGATESADFPVRNALYDTYKGGPQPYPATQDAFVAKYNSSGALVFSTYIGGGTQQDKAYRVKIDASGSPVVAGITGSTDFPVKNAYQAQLRGGVDAFLFKLSSDGRTLVYSTYYGGSSDEGTDLVDDSDPNPGGNFLLGVRVDIDGAGNVYLGGNTHSRDLPIKNAFQATLAGGDDAFIAKFSLAFNRPSLVYGTYLGGRAFDACTGIAVDSVGRVFLCGYSDSAGFPQVNPVQPAYGGRTEGWVAKLDYTGLKLLFSSYIGGTGTDRAFRLEVDKSGNVIVTGRTDSTDFPVRNALVPQLQGGVDIFVTKIPPQGGSLLFSTYFGGGGGERGRGLALDSQDNICVIGETNSGNFPLRLPVQAQRRGGRDLCLVKIKGDGSALLNSTYFGGNAEERGVGVALDKSDNWYILSFTSSDDFSTPNAAQRVYGGNQDAGIAKISFDAYAAPSGPITPGVIVFVSNRDGNAEIYAMNDDGTVQTRLTRNSATDDAPDFQRNGSRIVFSSTRDGNREIYIMNADGSGQTRLTNNAASDYDPVFSPNGTRITFVSTRDGNPEIYQMNADGSNVLRMTNNAAIDDAPAWSADGTAIAFQSNRSGNTDIYAMNAAPGSLSGQARLTTFTRNDHRPAWSGDSNAIAFQSDRDSNYEIYIMATDGLRQTRLTTNGYIDTAPCFSPDGGRIAFTSNRGGDNEICVMKRTGESGGVTVLTNNIYADYDPSWGPGRLVAPLIRSRHIVPLELSAGSADAQSGTLQLTFASPVPQGLEERLTVQIGGNVVAPQSITREGQTLTLQLPSGALKPGDEVQLFWPGGDAKLQAE
jgi:hypothetical protein